MATFLGYNGGSVYFQLLFIPAGDRSSYCFSGVVDAFHYLCGRFACCFIDVELLLHWFLSELAFYMSVPLRAMFISGLLPRLAISPYSYH